MTERHLSIVETEITPLAELSPDEYSKSLVKDVVNRFQDLGLAPEFLPIAGQHIEDLHVLIPSGDEATSNLKVMPRGSGSEKSWHRVALLSRSQLKRYGASIINTFADLELIELLKDKPGITTSLATDWLFFELSTDAAANSCHMQHRYDKYIPDYNGQADIDLAQLTISRVFYGKHAEGEDVDLGAVARDHDNLRSGMALLLLKDEMLRRGIGLNQQMANWVINSLKARYPHDKKNRSMPVEPLDEYGIIERLIGIAPRKDVRRRMEEFAIQFDTQE